MKTQYLLLAFLFCSSLCPALADVSSNAAPYRVLCVGDSITQGGRTGREEGVMFDPDHEGYYGAKTKDALAKVMAAWNDQASPPDFVLIHLGTNDQGNTPHEETVQKPLREFVAFLRTKNPRVVVLLGHLNFNDSKGANSIRPLVEALASELNTPESPVATVHPYKGWFEMPDKPQSDTFDWAHPNPQGQMKMAKAWFEAMRPTLEKSRAK